MKGARNSLILKMLLVVCLFAGIQAKAADFQKGLEASLKGDHATALKEWHPLAEQGHGEAQFYLGVIYDKGLGAGVLTTVNRNHNLK